jgi:predicted permease
MAEVFDQALGRARTAGPRAVLRLVAREALDLVATGARLRLGRERRARETGRARARTGGRRLGEEVGTMTGWIGGLGDDARQGLRSLWRRPTFTLFAAVTIALGVGATTAIFSALESVILNPLPYRGADRIVGLWRTLGDGNMLVTPDEEVVESWRAQADLFEAVEPVRSTYPDLTGAGEAARVQVALVRPSFFDFLGVDPVLGRRFTAEETADDGAAVALISWHVWQERFGGDPSALGRTLRLDGRPVTVIGVMPARMPMPNGLPLAVDLFRPPPDSRPLAGASVVARLREGVTVPDVEARMDLLAERAEAAGDDASKWSGTARRTVDLVGSAVKENLRVLMIAVVLLLLIACVNVSNLLLGRASRRAHETAVRSALGAGRGRLVRQQLLESLFLGLLGGGLGVGLAWLAVRGMASLRGDALAVLGAVRLDGRVLAFGLAVSLASALAAGVVPALRTAFRAPAHGLTGARGVGGRARGEGRARWLLLTAEVALSFALLVGASLVLRSLADLRSRDPGFRADGLVALRVSLPEWKYEGDGWRDMYGRMRTAVARLPSVTSVVRTSGIPPKSGVFFGSLEVEGRGEIEGSPLFYGMGTEPGYFSLVGQRILEGRDFTPEELDQGLPVVVLGEGAAHRLFPDGAAVGKRVRHQGEWRTVVGVVEDVAHAGLSGPTPELQQYQPLDFAGGWLVARVEGPADEALGAIRREVLGAEPDAVVLELAPVEGMLQATLGRERFTTALLGAFAILALVLSAVGLYGVVSQLVGQRTREIGIRMSLGAKASAVRRMVLGQGLAATAAGVTLGIVLALVGLRLLRSRVFGVHPAGPGVYAAAAVVLAGVALVACWLPAGRAASVDPSRALRTD